MRHLRSVSRAHGLLVRGFVGLAYLSDAVAGTFVSARSTRSRRRAPVISASTAALLLRVLVSLHFMVMAASFTDRALGDDFVEAAIHVASG